MKLSTKWYVADFETTSHQYYIENGYTKVWLYAICDENAEIVDIPAYIKDLPVYSIEYNAFENCKSIKEIVIPETVISFNHALAKCVNIEKLTTPISDMYKLFANATPKKLKYIGL